MATKTRAEMIDWALEHVGVKAATQSASAEDSTAAGRVLDSLHDRLMRDSLVNFGDLTAVPEWAQQPLIEIAGAELAATYRISGEPLQMLLRASQHGYDELQRQSMHESHKLPTVVVEF